LKDFRGFPVFVLIKSGKYYWFRNSIFKRETIYNWIDDILNNLAYITGEIPWEKIPQNVTFFWKEKGHLTEPLSKVPLKTGSPVRNNFIQMGEAPDIWNELWFVAVSADGSMLFLDSLLAFQRKFQKLLNPVTVKEWTYKYIIPTLEWPGWSKFTNLTTLPIEKRQIETALAPLKEYLVLSDEKKNVDFKKSEFYIFFEGKEEEEPLPPPTFDISEFGDIGTINVNLKDFDLPEAPSKFSKSGGGAKKPGGPVRMVPRQAPIKTASNTVQDQIFDYLGEMLKKTVVSDEREINEDEVVEEDLDNL